MPNPTPHKHLPRRAAAAATAVATALLAAASAHAATNQAVAAGPGGGAHFAWVEQAAGYQTLQRSLGGDGALSGVQVLSWAYRHVLEQRIGADAAGNALVAWRSSGSGVMPGYIRRRSASGALGEIQRLSPADASLNSLRLAVEPDGDAIAVWQRTLDGRAVVQARRRAAEGTLGPVRTLSAPDTDAYDPEVAVTPTGAATVVWIRAGAEGSFPETRTVVADGRVSAVQALDEPVQALGDLRVTVSDAGAAVAAWARYGDGAPGHGQLVSRARGADGVLGPIQTISPDGEYTGFPDLAGNAAGRTVYVWNFRAPGASSTSIRGRVRRSDGALGPVFEVTAAPLSRGVAAIDPGGQVSDAWELHGDIKSVRLRRRTADGTLGPVRVLSDPSVPSTWPHLVVDGAGRSTVAWRTEAGRWQARSVTVGGTVSPLRQLSEAAQ